MSDISKELGEIANAELGEEVRGSLINGLKKVNDDNNSYQALKTEVINAKNEVVRQVAAIDTKATEVNTSITNLTNKISEANTTKSNLDKSKTAADTSKTNLDKSKTAADTSKTNLDASVSTANKAKDNLQAVVNSASDVNSAIGRSVTAANTAAQNANTAAESANTAASGANTARDNANTAASAANNAASGANTARDNANTAASAANNAAQSANTAKTNADKATESANNAASEATKQANEAKTAAASVRDDCYPMMFREYDGKVYSVFFENADTTMVSTGTKQDDNEGIAIPVPSTNAVRNANPYDEIPLFKPVECNAYVDADGETHITAVKGEPTFKEDGSNGDVVIALKTGYIRTVVDTVGVMGPLGKKGQKISVTDSWRESEYPGFPFIPYSSAIRPDSTVRPYVVIPKYQAVDYNGSYYSLPGKYPVYNVSHNNQITTFRKRGTQYCGETCADAQIWETLFAIVFANLNSQAVVQGCTNYSAQYAPSVYEESVERFIVTNAQASYFVVGSCVSIGDKGGNSSDDRYNGYMHNLADRKKITKIEALEDGKNTAIYVDNGGAVFTTTSTCRISCMPWITGSTNKVKGTCGSPNSYTNAKEPFKFLDIEFALGQYVVRSDVIMNGVYDADNNLYHQEVWTCHDCVNFSTGITDKYLRVGYDVPDSNNSWQYIKNLGFDVEYPQVRMPSAYGADSSKRYADAAHTGGRANGTREFLSLGYLGYGTLAGLRIACLNASLGHANWHLSARPSFTGRRGTVADWAKSQGVNLEA